MTAKEELDKLEATYSAWLDAGCPESYSINGRSVTKANIMGLIPRMDQLRAQIFRQTGGMFSAARFRLPE